MWSQNLGTTGYLVKLRVTDRNTHVGATSELRCHVVEASADRRRFTCDAPSDGVCTEYTVRAADYDRLIGQCGGVLTEGDHVCASGPSCTFVEGDNASRTYDYGLPPADVEAGCVDAGGGYQP